MPKKSRNSTFTRARSMRLAGAALALLPLTSLASADSLADRVIACAAETDALQRVACFDKNVTPLAKASAVTEAKRDAAAYSSQQELKSNAEPETTVQERAAQNASRHIRARVVSVDTGPDRIVVRLDNGQVWEQIEKASVNMSLRAGDAVRIDMRSVMGSYWLRGPGAGAIKVKLKE